MTNTKLIANAVSRRLEAMFPRYFNLSRKHDHFRDFGWPDTLTFEDFYRLYRRNGLAFAGVDKTILKTWQSSPEVWEREGPTESEVEADIRQRFSDLRIWHHFAEADRRSMVGRYAGVILRFRDSKSFDQPVDQVPGGLDGLAGVIPVWESQLRVGEWVSDPDSEDYGQPKFFEFNESAIGGDKNSPRKFRVHPDRVLIWSDDGTVHGRSALEPGYNDLLDAEKVKGAGGEGFWKTSRGAPVIEAPEGMSPADVAKNMGVSDSDLLDKINEQMDSFQAGFDKALLLGGMTAKPMTITLPSPEHFFAVAVQGFAASIGMPIKILLGSQTGERASTEDAKEWAQTCTSRRVMRNLPLIREFINRLERVGILQERDWHVEWADLTEATADEKMDRAKAMAEINAKHPNEYVFTPDEIREVADYDPLSDADRYRDEEDEEEAALMPPARKE